ncbi:hypothetical protein N7476_001024 [Penicillium atrosanguineum]|uniref:Rhodopsin domain-containing protein n=1 Tax=Penicillium atrosanguineum TaxID=1132637 RepID=A0A9W9QCL3_9EURO|nr:hypothetical protein N7476_001024 [Penicillium atrosanguineum]
MTEANVNLNASRVTAVIVCYSVPIPFMLLFTGLRLFVKLRPSSRNPMALDDYMIIGATVLHIDRTMHQWSGLRPPYGFGRHKAALPEQELETFMLGDYVFSHFYNFAIASTKLAILALYYRIFSTKLFQRIIIGTAVFIFLWIAAMEIGLGLQCVPVAKAWDPNVKGDCLNLVAFSYFTNITNLVTDIWVFLLPVPIILRLHIDRKRKLELAGIFTIGLLTCAISIARLTVVVSQGSTDFTWTGVPLGILSVYEPLGGILCANLPFLYKHATSVLKKVVSSFGPVQTEGMLPETGVRRPQYLLWKRKQDLSMQSESEWSRLQRDTDKNTSTTMSEVRSAHAADGGHEIEESRSMIQDPRGSEP